MGYFLNLVKDQKMLKIRLLFFLVLFALLTIGCGSSDFRSNAMNSALIPETSSQTHLMQEAVQNLLSPDFFVHSEGAEVLVRHGKESIPFLLNALQTERAIYNEQVPAIQPVLTKIFDELNPSDVLSFLTHTHPSVRSVAVARLGESGQIALLQNVAPLLHDRSSEVQKEATLAVNKLEALKLQTAYLIQK